MFLVSITPRLMSSKCTLKPKEKSELEVKIPKSSSNPKNKKKFRKVAITKAII